MIVVIAGPCRVGIGDLGFRIYTAYGSQAVAPREWWENSLKPHEAVESAKFWSEHALSMVGVRALMNWKSIDHSRKTAMESAQEVIDSEEVKNESQ